MAEVIRAVSAGFCMGVGRALQLLQKEEIKKNVQDTLSQITTLGPIIHNTQVLEELEEKGIYTTTLEELESFTGEQTVVIRAHGIPKNTEEVLRSKEGINIVDATCPKVKDAQVAVREACSQGYSILLYGEEDHAEVKGLCSYAEEVYVFSSLEELQNHKLIKDKAYALLSQTTQSITEFETIYTWLTEYLLQPVLYINTICDATYIRQKEVMELVKEVEAMVIVGGYTSGNTRRLAEIASAKVPTIHIEKVEELPLKELQQYRIVGLSAGASTPKEYIDAVEDALRLL